ncbi:hypothetical protein [Acidithiobacillus ferriphilus]|uniref:hypothetical protein n=1 Tax=Acidithiobacillus ferriphilus TaxID=1689834 RepID=UPI001C0771C5|nr:hypothetical protein [Acidithiobacillus ferriphilus]MBU2854814.1 hypothetical protein [Acidithiobacillus ferriphilus]
MSILENVAETASDLGGSVLGFVGSVVQVATSIVYNFPIISSVSLVLLAGGALLAVDVNQGSPSLQQMISTHNSKAGSVFWTMEAGGFNAGVFGSAKGEKTLVKAANTYCLSHTGYAGCAAVEAGISQYYKGFYMSK